MKPIIQSLLILALLLIVGCATPTQPGILGRWTIAGSNDVVVFSRDESGRLSPGRARLISGKKSIAGTYRFGAPDLVIVSFPADGSRPAQERAFSVRPDSWLWRSLQPLGKNGFQVSPVLEK
jgi:hypothetical protein